MDKDDIIINQKGNKLFLTKRYENIHFAFGEVWKNVEVYTIYQRKTFFGLFSYWKKYTNYDAKKVFEKFEKLCKITNKYDKY